MVKLQRYAIYVYTQNENEKSRTDKNKRAKFTKKKKSRYIIMPLLEICNFEKRKYEKKTLLLFNIKKIVQTV